MFENAKHYNAEGSSVYLDAETLQVSILHLLGFSISTDLDDILILKHLDQTILSNYSGKPLERTGEVVKQKENGPGNMIVS
jgi:hypothetical protein